MRAATSEIWSRRDFLKALAAGGGVLIASCADSDGAVFTGRDKLDPESWVLHDFLWLAPTGLVTILAHRSEMGTGIRTALPMVVADEMEADWDQVAIKQAIGDSRYGDQNTDGSNSIRGNFERMRRLGAAARDVLERAAAAVWEVDVRTCKASNHKVEHAASGRSLGFGELVEVAIELKPQGKSAIQKRLKDRKDWRYIGIGVGGYDMDAIVTGSAVFGGDIRLPNMLFASIERSPVLGGEVAKYDKSAALAVAGVEQVIELPFITEEPFMFQALGGIAVLARDSWSAMQGRAALNASWKTGAANASFSSDSYNQAMMESVRKPGTKTKDRGDVEAGLAGAAQKVEAEYSIPLLAHACMETPTATAEVTEEGCQVWSPTQNPQAVQDTVAQTLGLSKKAVTAHVTLLGGGFGRKSKPDYTAEAALLARETGRPVQVLWTRADDLQHDYYHAVSAQRMEAGLDDQGMPVAWLQRAAYPSIASTFGAGSTGPAGFELGMGFHNMPVAAPAMRTETGIAKPHVRIGWLRSVANIQHAFAVSSFADEIAAAGKHDSYQAWTKMLIGKKTSGPSKHIQRLLDVSEAAASAGEWGKELPRGRGLGFAAHHSFDAYIAVVVEVEISKAGELRIPRVDIAADVGTVVHPDRVRAQMEGSVNFGLSQALFGKLTALNGVIEQTNFDGFRLLRLHEAPPQINVHLTASDGTPTGVGEPGVPPIAPALCNAIFAAIGKRVRDLPVDPHDLSWS
ncbi:MAG: xanthine dehydrogenase family protein molybdopterin-binding subunit [Planctomycetes bacterium]|nr:xanthine dehydrogenase family protein molybdopterin-binding subunit [Planctomycetota bacterium]MCP4772219.1 xanthine dehydrogenase family protein molybdopterin-binding subunit [Planctomycetota bacterium]MCP4861275.1 xanthine dehydrogenase family protein molybdopterin-binding subunit [Planctomycetota bacterium]